MRTLRRDPLMWATVELATVYQRVFVKGPASAALSRPSPVRHKGFDLDVVVTELTRPADEVVGLTLEMRDGTALPEWTPGAHLDVFTPSGAQRQYSLCGDPGDRTTYRIAVRRIPKGTASREIHEVVTAGMGLRIRGPRNAYYFVDAPSYLFVAGGIGITPILPMYRAAVATGKPAGLIYTGRSRATMPFLNELEAIGGVLSIRPDDECGPPDVAAMLRDVEPAEAVYVCGPPPMLDAARAAMPVLSPAASLHSERFSARPVSGGRAFTATLARSGRVIEIGETETLLSAVRRVEPGVAYSCQQGFCSSCKTRVLGGRVEHRDHLLLDHERADAMLLCVSRALDDHLVLDV